MGFIGPRKETLFTTSVAALLPNRFLKLTKTTMVSEYTTYGENPDGRTSSLSVLNGDGTYNTGLELTNLLPNSFWVKLASAAAKGDALICVANGQVAAKSYTVVNGHEPSAPSPEANATYLVPAAGWSSLNGNAIAVYTLLTTSWKYTAAVAGMVVYNTAEAKYYVFDGTNWVAAKPACYAEQAGVLGDEITAYIINSNGDVNLPNNMGFSIVLLGQSASETEADATVTVLDARIAAGDVAFCTPEVSAYAVESAVCTAGTLTITLEGNGGAGTIINYMIVRAKA